MNFEWKASHEVLLAGSVMVLGLIGMGGLVAHDYVGRLGAGAIPDRYQGPIVRIRKASDEIRSHLSRHVPLENLDALYEERVFEPIVDVPEPEPVEDAAAGTVDPGSVSFRLTGIAWSPRKPVAFLNGQSVTVGDTIQAWTVTEITRDRVTLTGSDGQRRRLTLYGKSDG